MSSYVFNLKELINAVNSTKIWLYYATIRALIYKKYPDISHKLNRELTNNLMEYVRDFKDYKFVDGTEYIITEKVRV